MYILNIHLVIINSHHSTRVSASEINREIIWREIPLIRLRDIQMPLKRAEDSLNQISSCPTNLSSVLHMSWGQSGTYSYKPKLYWIIQSQVCKICMQVKCVHRSSNQYRILYFWRTQWTRVTYHWPGSSTLRVQAPLAYTRNG